MTGRDSPWLRIPASDYEGHMAGIGQSAALRAIFARIYAETRPRRLLVLGCTTGKDLGLIDPRVTTRAVGLDVNAEYLATARGEVGRDVELVHGDVLAADLSGPFDLVHAALLVEYVDPAALFRRIGAWLAPGGACSVVSQDPVAEIPSVSETAYISLRALEGGMRLVRCEELVEIARQAGLARTSSQSVSLPGGKSFSVSIFAACAARIDG